MNVNVELELCTSVTEEDRSEAYGIAEVLTIDYNSINIYQPKGKRRILIVEFTISKVRQIDVVDRIGKEFSSQMKNYSQLGISFPTRPTKI